jgi:hypothetical protein
MDTELVIVPFIFTSAVVALFLILHFRFRRQQLDHAEAVRSLELGLPLPPRPVSNLGNVYSLPLFLLGGGIGVGIILLLNSEPAAWGVMALLCLPGVGLLLSLRLNAPRYKEELERARMESEAYRQALTDRLERNTVPPAWPVPPVAPPAGMPDGFPSDR